MFKLFNRPTTRTRDEVIAAIQRALLTQGDSDWDDFVSIPISDPELEAVRQECLDVTMAPAAVFENKLKELLSKLQPRP